MAWYDDMVHLTDAANAHRIFTSPYCFDAHREGPDVFELFVLASGVPTEDEYCWERTLMDALKADTRWVDYNSEVPCMCARHPLYGPGSTAQRTGISHPSYLGERTHT